MAEGVVSEPLLPSGDQGRKGGFAPLPKQPPIACRITNGIPHKDKPFPRSIGRKTWREHAHSQELATGSNQAKQTVLAGTSRIAQHDNPAKIIFESRAITFLIHWAFFHQMLPVWASPTPELVEKSLALRGSENGAILTVRNPQATGPISKEDG